METIRLQVDNSPDFEFNGRLLAEVHSNQLLTSKTIPDKFGVGALFSLYETKGGKLVCHKVLESVEDVGGFNFTASVCGTSEGVVNFFGYHRLAKMLYMQAGIDIEVLKIG